MKNTRLWKQKKNKKKSGTNSPSSTPWSQKKAAAGGSGGHVRGKISLQTHSVMSFARAAATGFFCFPPPFPSSPFFLLRKNNFPSLRLWPTHPHKNKNTMVRVVFFTSLLIRLGTRLPPFLFPKCAK